MKTIQEINEAKAEVVKAYRIARVNAGITQEAIAERAGCHSTSVYQTVKGESAIALAALWQMLPEFAAEYLPRPGE